MISTHKYRIYPSKSQISNLNNQLNMLRYLYNWNLEERINSYKKDGKSINYYDQASKLVQLKKDKPWFKSIHSQALQAELKILDQSFQNFFRTIKTDKSVGFPKFKSKDSVKSIHYPQFSKRPIDNQLTIPKIGTVKIIYHRQIPLDAKIKKLTVRKDGYKWFVCFCFERNIQIQLKTKEQLLSSCIGVDLGLNDFIYDSNGNNTPAPKFLRVLENKLKKLQKKLSKTTKRTALYYKLLKRLQNIYYRIRCQRHDFFHKLSNKLLKSYDLIVCENLNIKNMTKKPKAKQDDNGTYIANGASAKAGLNKSILDAGWNNFLTILENKAKCLGKLVLFVNPAYTSQKCSNCGTIVKKSLSVRTHICSCGLQLNRDHNAAINILTLGTESLTALAV